MNTQDKAELFKKIIIAKEQIDKALHGNANSVITFKEALKEVDSASTKLNQALEAYERLSEADREKELHAEYDKVDK